MPDKGNKTTASTLTSMNKIPNIAELEDFQCLQQEIMKMALELKGKVMIQAAEQALGRPMVMEDSADFSLLIRQGFNFEILAYKGVPMGAIKLTVDFIDGRHSFNWTFNPAITKFW